MITQMFCSSPQAIGYFIASITGPENPPVVCVLSRNTLDLGIFPFHYGKKSRKEVAINAVSIPFGSIQSDVEFYSGVVCLLVLLSFPCKLKLTSAYSGIADVIPKRAVHDHVYRTEMETMLKQLEDVQEALTIEKEERAKNEEALREERAKTEDALRIIERLKQRIKILEDETPPAKRPKT